MNCLSGEISRSTEENGLVGDHSLGEVSAGFELDVIFVDGFKAVRLECFIVELVALFPGEPVHGQELLAVVAAERSAEEFIDDLDAHGGGDILGAHGEYVEVVGSSSAFACRDALNYTGLYMGAFAGCDMDSHACTAEYETFLIFTFGDLCTDLETYAVEHFVHAVFFAAAYVFHMPAKILEMEDQIGSIEPGKDADLIFCTGSILDSLTQVRRVIVNGQTVVIKI